MYNEDRNFGALLKNVQQAGEDHEWYPTTNEIIDALFNDISLKIYDTFSILDCGAGDGKVLKALQSKGEAFSKNNSCRVEPKACYAIEQSQVLIDALPKDVFVVGTDYYSQSLLDKKVDIVFSNPLFSDYQNWCNKLIREAHAKLVYLVIPTRWKDSSLIKGALKSRKATASVVSSFSFSNSEDRKARAEVDLVRIELSKCVRRNAHSDASDPFSLWFDSFFKIDDKPEDELANSKESIKSKINNEVVKGGNLIEALELLYNQAKDNLLKNYLKVCELDPVLLNEIGVSTKGLEESLKLKISGLKDLYWTELFNNLDRITSRLTSSSRSSLLAKLTSSTHVDFTASNAYAVVTWALKNCNYYIDSQLTEVFDSLLQEANVHSYKSNKKIFSWSHYGRCKEASHVKLDHRIVVSGFGGGIETHSFYSYKAVNGLKEASAELLNDLVTVANNLGFTCNESASSFEWSSGKKNAFKFKSLKTQKMETLMEVKAFRNGNIHIKFNMGFITSLNIEMGRLKSWLRSADECSVELEISTEEAQQYFKSNLKLGVNSLSNLLPAPVEEPEATIVSSDSTTQYEEQQSLEF